MRFLAADWLDRKGDLSNLIERVTGGNYPPPTGVAAARVVCGRAQRGGARSEAIQGGMRATQTTQTTQHSPLTT